MLNLVESANRVVVVTGAGFSAPSGLPVYRNGGANWLDQEGERISHASRYGNHLPKLWSRWHILARLALDSEPNAAHLALARWDRQLASRDIPGSMTIVTQNVDGLHQRAGSQNVLEVHGSILKARQLNKPQLFDYEPTPGKPIAPMPPNGTRRTRPDIVLFGERPRHMKQATQAVRDADLVIFAGTSGQVWPVAGLLVVANETGTTTMLLNDTKWEHGHFDITMLDDVLAVDQLDPNDCSIPKTRHTRGNDNAC